MKRIKRLLHSFSTQTPSRPQYLSLRVTVTDETHALADGTPISLAIGGPGDVERIVSIQEICYGGKAPWNAHSVLEDMNTNRQALYLLAKDGRHTIGFIGAKFSEDDVHLTNLAVLPRYQKQGVATVLLKEIKRLAMEEGKMRYTLEVRVSNLSAQSVYKEMGFVEGNIKKGYYHPDREDALEMILNLDKETTGR